MTNKITNSEPSESTMSNIEQNVMRRVHTIHFLRPIISGGALAALVALLALYGIGREVWVARVFENGPQGIFAHSLYLAYAFEHTRLLVQVLSLATLAALIYLARETAKLISYILIPVRTT